MKQCEDCRHFYQIFEDGLHGTRFPVDDKCGKMKDGDNDIDRDSPNEIGKNCPL